MSAPGHGPHGVSGRAQPAAASYTPPDQRAAIEAVFDEALDVPTSQRAAWLAARCGDDGALRREVELLLAAHEQEDSVLDAPAAGRVAAVLDDSARGRRIGPYRVLRELGRGGMGVVYLAERDDGHYRHRVAVKVLRASPDADELHRRFLAERQILASLSHPNIAQLLDGGVSEGQLPYLVIEYVDGMPITEYCDRHRLGVGARLRLFQDVCAAVHHAHQNLVLHRDLKPGNVLVTAAGQVKLLDFGIAKLLNPSMAGPEQPVTRTAFRMMTPAYASPEQVRGDSLTTTSDVYALGLLLYELLVGRPAHRLTPADTPRAVFEVVCEREPERPSACAARDEATAAARDTTAERLRRRLRGDLDAILAMALRKEPGRRYGSAELFAADVGRELEGLPVLAQRGSNWYRFEKLLRRHRAAAAFAATAALLLVGGAAVGLTLASTAARERDRAAHALVQSQRTLRESEEMTDFLVDLFEASDPAGGRRDTLATADLLRRGLERAERLAGEPLAQARMLDALGRVFASREDLPRAAELLGRAAAIWRAQLGADHATTAATTAELADVLRRQGRYASADTLAREALRVRRRALGGAHPDVAASLRQLSSIAIYLGDLANAEAFQREAVAVSRGGGPRERGALEVDLQRLGGVLRRRSDDAGAEAALREALAIREQAGATSSADHAATVLRLADLLDTRPATRPEAESLYLAALAETRAIFGDAHAETAQAMKQVGLMLARHGRRAEGERMVRQALALQRRVWGPTHTEVASTMISLAHVFFLDGYSAEGEQLVRGALPIFATTLGTGHSAYAATLGYLADFIALRGALDSAEMLYRRAVATRAAAFGPHAGITALTSGGLAGVLVRRRRFAEADSIYRQALATVRTYTPETNADMRGLYAGMAALFEAQGRRDSAAVYRRRAGADDWRGPWP